MITQREDLIEFYPIADASDEELLKISRERTLSLNLPEMKAIRAYYSRQGRNPTDVEMECIAQTWSEHCKHKVFNGLTVYSEEGREAEVIDNLFKNTIVKATNTVREHKGKDDICVSVFKDNAGVIKFDDEFNLAFKVETHNHPSALDPYGGANTGIGGVIRDPLGTGLGARPFFNTDIFCFGPPDLPYDELPEGVLHPKRIMKGVVAGVRDYGNRMGIPTVNGAVLFDERYIGNPLVYCGTGGTIPVDKMEKAARPGDKVLVAGGKTGRDGIHGATFSSIELDHKSEETSSSAVQIGNAIVEKKTMDVILQARDLGLYDCITDCGAGGFSSAVGEMGRDIGVRVFLDKAPLKYSGLRPWEIFLSEAQERMVMSVPPGNLDRIMAMFEAEDVEAVVIGEFTDDKMLRVFYADELVAEIGMEFLHGAVPRVERKAVWSRPHNPEPEPSPDADLAKMLLSILSDLDVCSKEWVIRQYDHEVQGGSVVKPLTGVGNDGPSDAAVVRPRLDSDRAVVVSCGINPLFGDIDPYHMACSVIDEAIRNAVAVGVDFEHLALLDNFCWGNPDKPPKLGDLVRCARGCHDAAVAFGAPFISGKDSFYNEFATPAGTISVPPTLLISAIGVLGQATRAVTMDFKKAGNIIYQVGRTYPELGGSVYWKQLGFIGNSAPMVRFKEAANTFQLLSAVMAKGLVRSCHDLSQGGLGAAAAEMAFAGGLGAEIDLAPAPRSNDPDFDDWVLFSESNSRFLVEVEPGKARVFENALEDVPLSPIGKVNDSMRLVVKGVSGGVILSVPIDELKQAWITPLRW